MSAHGLGPGSAGAPAGPGTDQGPGPGLLGLYAQHLSAPEPQPYAGPEQRHAAQLRAAEKFSQADAVVVGIGSGMSSSCGYDYYHRTPAFDGLLARFERAHGFSTLMDGFYHLFATNEERWAFYAALSHLAESAPVGDAYRTLARLLAGRAHAVITTNIDTQARRAFAPERTWLFQGDLGFLQCSQPCCDRVVPAGPVLEPIRAALQEQGSQAVTVPADLLPRCPECGWLMAPWVRDDGFLEGAAWQHAGTRYQDFVLSVLKECRHVVFLELGVGGMTPAIIELPFWNAVAAHANAFYLRINKGKASEPRQLAGRSLTVCADISETLDVMAAALGRAD